MAVCREIVMQEKTIEIIVVVSTSQMSMYDIDYTKSTEVSPLEGQVLAQYQFLASQLNVLSQEISHLTVKATEEHNETKVTGSAHNLSENLRNLEMKIGLIHTLFKGAVYTLFLEQDQEEHKEKEESAIE